MITDGLGPFVAFPNHGAFAIEKARPWLSVAQNSLIDPEGLPG
jgi:hypothetical protein